MSAYVVDRDLIRFLVTAATSVAVHGQQMGLTLRWRSGETLVELHYGDRDRAQAVGQMLWNENLASVRYRYPDEPDSELPGPIGETFVYAEHRDWLGHIEPIQVIKSAHCLRYQSCEHPGWEASSAAAFLEALIGAAIRVLPGYDTAVWGVPAEPFAGKRCQCENVHCSAHDAGACKVPATVSLTMFGHRADLCQPCGAVALGGL